MDREGKRIKILGIIGAMCCVGFAMGVGILIYNLITAL